MINSVLHAQKNVMVSGQGENNILNLKPRHKNLPQLSLIFSIHLRIHCLWHVYKIIMTVIKIALTATIQIGGEVFGRARPYNSYSRRRYGRPWPRPCDWLWQWPRFLPPQTDRDTSRCHRRLRVSGKTPGYPQTCRSHHQRIVRPTNRTFLRRVVLSWRFTPRRNTCRLYFIRDKTRPVSVVFRENV